MVLNTFWEFLGGEGGFSPLIFRGPCYQPHKVLKQLKISFSVHLLRSDLKLTGRVLNINVLLFYKLGIYSFVWS